VFGDKRTGRYLVKFAWYKTVRHVPVRGKASPDDPGLRDYWWSRRAIAATQLNASDRRLGEKQGWICRLCGMPLMNGEELHRHHTNAKALGGSDTEGNRELVHLYCHQQETYRQFRGRGGRRTPADG
jgi:RNA-directed DNA polymerase